MKVASKFDGIDKTMSCDDVERLYRRRGRLTSGVGGQSSSRTRAQHRGDVVDELGKFESAIENVGRLKLVKNSSCWLVRSKTVPWTITFWKFPKK